MKILILPLILCQIQAEDPTLTSLDDGPGILPFNIGTARIVTHYHSFLQIINLKDIRDSITIVKDQLNSLTPNLHDKLFSLYNSHIEHLHYKIIKLSNQLETFEPNRIKRGLIDGLGSVIKSISGNLDYTDAIKYDTAIKLLQNNENKLVTEMNNHISLSKDWIEQQSDILNNLIKNQEKIEIAINDLKANNLNVTLYIDLIQRVAILSDNIDDISEELHRLENLLGFIRAKSTHHLMFNSNSLKEMLNKLHKFYGKEQIPQVNYREYFDLVKLGYYYSNRNIVIVFMFPVVLPATFELFKLSIVPNKDSKVLIPPYPFVAIHNEDFMYMEAECPKSGLGYLCEDKLNHHRSKNDCVYHLITTQRVVASCLFTPVELGAPALEKLDDAHYVISFPKPSKIHLSCSQDQYDVIKGSYLATIPKNCILQTEAFKIVNREDHIKGQIMKIANLPDSSQYNTDEEVLKLNSINLDKLHASNRAISMEMPISTNNGYEILYLQPSIIPIYVILITSAVALVTWYVVRRLRTSKPITTSVHGNQKEEIEHQSAEGEISAILTSLARQ
ncbi:uncharacterized protein LOC123703635 [Colias croceus]|uniref:uncharacterized protein LOC123703635 n=2 Tax=Colias crocea TaxID=72248 RepID=UPI001E27C2AD|nr:uncharacterized protein LOC123703635 [Colias croceus]